MSIVPLIDSILYDVASLRWKMKRIGWELRMIKVDDGLILYFSSHGLAYVEEETDGVERTTEVGHKEW